MGCKSSKPAQQKRICIIGGGAAGTACSWSLSRYPELYAVTVFEGLAEIGGVASTCEIEHDGEKVDINDQVQGGAPSYRNNLLLFKEVGFEPHKVDFTVAFGTKEHAWSNHGPSKELVKKLQPEIARFGKCLKWINRLEPIFIFIPIDNVLKWWGFSDDFRARMVFPLTALFFGTGNQTPNVSAAVVARVFLDPQLRLFQYSPERLLDQVPEMFAFPKLQSIYDALAESMPATVKRGDKVESVVRTSKGVQVVTEAKESFDFDDVVFACGAEEAKRMLGGNATWLEKKLLNNVKYYNDLIVTHCDEQYMQKHYEFEQGTDMYFIRTDPANPRRVEMSFDLTAYQPHLQGKAKIYQSIFLDDNEKEHWTLGEIDGGKILKKRMTRQFAHTWRHFAFWVPFVRFIQGKRRTWYAGAYTLFNTHEIAVMSGFAAAERLGAPYPYGHDTLASKQYDLYLKVGHGLFVRRRKPFSSNSNTPAATVTVTDAVGGK